MRVGIVTFHFSENFGAAVQGYGLRQWFRTRGIDAQFVNYHPDHVEAGGRLSLKAGLKGNLKTAYLWYTQIRNHILISKEKRDVFLEFQKNELGVGGDRISSPEQFDKMPDFDLLVFGSDQIWNPSAQFGVDPVYFGNIPGRARKISYAASFGKPELAAPFHAQAAKLLGEFDAISVREESGVRIVAQLTGRSAECVPDPTILLGDFADLIARNSVEAQNFVFCYALRSGEGIRTAAEVAARSMGAQKILSPFNAHRRWREVGETVYPSPGEWIAMISASRVVVTNSFHGVALSLCLSKPFVAVALPGERAALNERVRNLLTSVGLESRLVSAGDGQAVADLLATEIDWASVHKRLAILRSRGESFLEAQIKTV